MCTLSCGIKSAISTLWPISISSFNESTVATEDQPSPVLPGSYGDPLPEAHTPMLETASLRDFRQPRGAIQERESGRGALIVFLCGTLRMIRFKHPLANLRKISSHKALLLSVSSVRLRPLKRTGDCEGPRPGLHCLSALHLIFESVFIDHGHFDVI